MTWVNYAQLKMLSHKDLKNVYAPIGPFSPALSQCTFKPCDKA